VNPANAAPAAQVAGPANAVPAAVTQVGEAAEDAYDQVATGDWVAAKKQLALLEQRLPQFQNAIAPNQASLRNQLTTEVQSLRQAIAAQNRIAAMQAANEMTRIANEVTSRYATVPPAAVAHLDYLGRKLQIEAAQSDTKALAATTQEVRQTWQSLRPEVIAKGGQQQAETFDNVLAELARATTSQSYAKGATRLLDEVDHIEAVFLH
jgi:hypothetical protein